MDHYEWIRFTSSNATAVCLPTKASIQAGRYPASVHLTDFFFGYKDITNNCEESDW